ncbi:hypothetical protein pb186bvf_001230 [Paramecium bursaria]
MDDEVPKPKKIEYKSKRFFLSSLNTYLGHQLVQILRNDKDHPHDPNIIVGSIVESALPVPKGVRKVVDTFKMGFLQQVILDSDVIVYDINTCDLAEAEYAIKTLKMGQYEQEKIIIIVSSVMVWSDTEPKEKKAGEDEDEPLPADSEEELQQPPADDDAPAKKEYVRFSEQDYPKRRSLPQYEALRSVESLCLALNKPNLKTFILCSGILYGMGEQTFYEHFKQAWLQQSIPFYGTGKNRVPCIHVKDLALFVSKIVEKQPNQKYIFAIDHNPNPQQKKIIQEISKGVGNGKIEKRDEGVDQFLIDLRMKPTKAFDAFLEEAQDDPGEDGVVIEKFTFNWWCKEGIRANIAKIRQEFIDYHQLKPIKIFITGPPAIGKSQLAQQLSEHYNIPKISIKQLIQEYLSQTTEEVETLKSSLEDTKRTLIEEAQAAYDIEKKKRKALGLPFIKFDDSKFEAKLTDEQLLIVYKWKLMQNESQNRGFILDAFPKTYEFAKQLFLIVEGEDTEEKKISINKLILPDHIISLKGDDDKIVERLKKQSSDIYDEEILIKRLKAYRQKNLNKGFPLLLDFFKEQKIDLLDIDGFSNNVYLLNQARSYVERNGKYNNYRHLDDEAEQFRLLQKKQELAAKQKQEIEARKLRDQKELELLKLQEEEYKIKQNYAGNYEKELLDTKSLPLRQYLNDNVVPFLTEGIVEIVNQNPTDPIDFLAQFLFRRSLQKIF